MTTSEMTAPASEEKWGESSAALTTYGRRSEKNEEMASREKERGQKEAVKDAGMDRRKSMMADLGSRGMLGMVFVLLFPSSFW